MASLNEKIEKVLKICRIDLLELEKNDDIIYFPILKEYQHMDFSSMPVDKILITNDGRDIDADPFRNKFEIKNKYLVKFETKWGLNKRIHLYAGSGCYCEPRSNLISSIKEYFGKTEDIFDDVMNFLNKLCDDIIEKDNEIKKQIEEENERKKEAEEKEKYKDVIDKRMRIEIKAKAILNKLGKKIIKESDHHPDYSECIYKGYGLEIIENGKWHPYGEGIYISYDNKTVLSPLEKYEFVDDKWIDLLDAIYSKTNEMSKEIDDDLYTVVEVMDKISQIAPSSAYKNDIENKSRRIVDKINEIMKNTGVELNVTSSYENPDYYDPRFTVYNDGKLVFNAVYRFKSDKPSSEKYDYLPCGSQYYCFEKSEFVLGSWIPILSDSTDKAFEKIAEEDKKIYDDNIEKKLKLIRNS